MPPRRKRLSRALGWLHVLSRATAVLLPVIGCAPLHAGRIHVLSGETGETSFVIDGVADDELGSAMANDLVPGGIVGLLLGAPGANGGEGKVWVFDPGSRAVREEIDSSDLAGPVERFGHTILDLGHIDSSGPVWWAIGAPAASDSATPPAVIVVREQGGELRELYRVEGQVGSLFGWSLGFLDDLDGDGEPEFLVGAPAQRRGRRHEVGAVFAYSGRTGAPLWSLRGKTPGQHLGFSVGPCGRVAREGEDLILGAPGDGETLPGEVYLASAEGKLSRTLEAPAGAFHFGYRVACHPRVAGAPALMVSAPTSSFRRPASGSFFLLASDGTVRVRLDGRKRSQLFGVSFAFWPHRDTLPSELVLVSSWERGGRRGRGQLEFLEQPDWKRRARRLGEQRFGRLGYALRATHDLDDDGFFELLVGEPARDELWLPGPPGD